MNNQNYRQINSLKSERNLSDSLRWSSKSVNKENFNETFDTYSVLFDNDKQNFSTSSEISLMDRSHTDKMLLLSINDECTMVKDISSTINNSSESEDNYLSANSSLHSEDDEDNEDRPVTSNVASSIQQNISIYEKAFEVSRSYSAAVDRNFSQNNAQQQQENDQQAKRDLSYHQERTTRSTDPNDDDDRAFEQFLQEHRNPINNSEQKEVERRREEENERPRRLRPIRRNSLKDFICDSSSDEEGSSDLHRKVTRMLDQHSPWRENEQIYQSNSSDESSFDTNSSSDNGEEPNSRTKKNKISLNFLESLSNHIPIEEKHSDAKQYFLRSGFKTNRKRQELSDRLFSIFNRDLFSSKLSEKVTITWSGRLTATAGHCTTRRSTLTATITLSNKVCDSPERCRDTLLHEMCHAAVSLIDGAIEHGHGPLWRQWTKRAEKCYPYLPLISVKHTYEINYKYIYRCIKCHYEVQRHSKSLNVDVDRCGKCLGRFELSTNSSDKTTVNETPKRTPNRYNLFIKEHFQAMKQLQPHLSTPQLMKELSQQYKKTIQKGNPIDLPDLNQLKI